jgi:uncharacterized surface protein with fasciclin (FAS1) repeats
MSFRQFALVVGTLIVAVLGLSACGSGSDDAVAPPVIPSAATATTASTPMDVLGVINSTPELSEFAHAIQVSGFTSTLTATGPVTVFAPSNAAVAKLGPDWAVMQSSAHAAALAKQLQFHVVLGLYPVKTLTDGELLTTAQGDRLRVIVKNGKTAVKNAHGVATIDGTGLPASNGVIAVVNRVLAPRS